MINITKLYAGLASESDRLRYDAGRPAKPIAVYNCTARCNLKCLHCYSRSDQCCGEYELTTAESKKLLIGLAEYKCPVVLFSGGEPLMREDLFELMTEAVRLGLRTVISTNGTLVTESAAKRFAEIGVSYVGVSLDGPHQVHDLFRAVKGAYQATMKGVENCRKAGVKTGLRFTITRHNYENVGAIFDIARQMDVRRICFYHLVRAGRAFDMDGDYLDAGKVRGCLDTIFARTCEGVKAGELDEVLTVGNHADGPYLLLKMAQEKHADYENARRLLLANGGNKSGQNIACIGWDGSVYADQFWRNYTLGNVREKSFTQIWDNAGDPVLAMLRDKAQFADPRCKTCRWFDLCRGNFRFFGSDPAIENWRLEPPCYLTEEEIRA